MRKDKYLISILLALITSLAHAQDISNFTQFFFNPYAINPSFAGIDGHGALFLTYRKQWSGIESSPTIANFSYHAPVAAGLSLGLNIANDKRGLLNNSGMLLTAAYSIPLGEHSFFRFGISGGGSWNTIDLAQIENITADPALANLLNQSAAVIGNAGVSLHLKSFHLGVAMPNLFTPAFVSKDAFTITDVKPFEAFVIQASNRFYFAKGKHIFEPYAVYRVNNGLPTQYEVAAVLHLNHLVWLGGSLKEEFGISAFGGIKLNKTFALGGSYTMKNTGANELSFPTYEVHLSLLGGATKKQTKKKNAKTPPIYSFVNTEIPKKSKAQELQEKYLEAIAKADKAFNAKHYDVARVDYQEASRYKPAENYPKTRISEIDKILAYDGAIKKADSELAIKNYERALADYQAASNLRPTEKYPKDKIAEINALLAKGNEAAELERKYKDALTKADDAFSKQELPAARTHYNTALSLKPKEKYPQDQLAEIERRLAITKATPKEPIKEPVKETPKEPVKEVVKEQPKEPAERHETFTRGKHPQELAAGNYVIVGVFGQGPNARGYAKRLVDIGFNANYGFLSEKNLWYVHVFIDTDINTTRTQRDKYRQMPMFQNAWLLTIEN
jgi:type IX secretion system PorP/SprF family membrane protein